MPTLLLTGFEPFHTYPSNPSTDVLEAIAEESFEAFSILTCQLSVEPDYAKRDLLRILKNDQPDAVLMMGLSAGLPYLTLERVAVNMMHFEYPDNNGCIYRNQPIIDEENAPTAYLSTLPLDEIQATWKALEIPSKISNSAGLYLCNLVMYQALHYLKTQHKNVPCGFLHLPASPKVALAAESYKQPIPYLPVSEMTRAVHAALLTIMQS